LGDVFSETKDKVFKSSMYMNFMLKKGFMGIAKVGIFLLSIFVLMNITLFFSMGVFSAEVASTTSEFNVSDTLVINWTGGYNITVTALNITGSTDSTNISVFVQNDTTTLYANYSQDTLYAADSYGNLSTANRDLCFYTSGTGGNHMRLIVAAENGSVTNISKTLNFSLPENVLYGNITNFTIGAYMLCPPGKYFGNITVSNSTNSSENASVNVTLQIPISTQNTINETTYIATFKGVFPSNITDYHSFWFNTSNITNVTSVRILLDDLSEDLDLFLFYSNGSQVITEGSMYGRLQSTNLSSNSESLILPLTHANSNELLEIRVYGNITSSETYNGYLYYSTLNVTYDKNATAIRRMHYGILDPNQTSAGINYTINNTDERFIATVNETIEVYKVQKWTNGTTSYVTDMNFSDFLVPSFAERIMIKVEWKGNSSNNATNWTVTLRNINNSQLNYSTKTNFWNMNRTNATKESFVVYETTFSESIDGFWTIVVKNGSVNTTNLETYNVTAYTWVNSSVWVNTNYTDGFDFNSSGLPNSTYSITSNISVPETSFVNGSYEGVTLTVIPGSVTEVMKDS